MRRGKALKCRAALVGLAQEAQCRHVERAVERVALGAEVEAGALARDSLGLLQGTGIGLQEEIGGAVIAIANRPLVDLERVAELNQPTFASATMSKSDRSRRNFASTGTRCR